MQRGLLGVWRGVCWGCLVGIFQVGVVECRLLSKRLCWVLLCRDLWWWLISFLFCRCVGLGVEFFFSFGFFTVYPPPLICRGLHLLRMFSSMFFFLAFFLDFLAVDGGCNGGCYGCCTDITGSVGSGVVAATFLVVVSVVVFALASVASSVVLWIGVFFPFWSSGSNLLPVCLGGPQVSEQDWWLGRWFFPGYCCWCCSCCW